MLTRRPRLIIIPNWVSGFALDPGEAEDSLRRDGGGRQGDRTRPQPGHDHRRRPDRPVAAGLELEAGRVRASTVTDRIDPAPVWAARAVDCDLHETVPEQGLADRCRCRERCAAIPRGRRVDPTMREVPPRL